MSVDDLRALGKSQWEALSVESLRALQTAQWAMLTPDDLKSLTAYQWSMLGSEDLASITPSQWSVLGSSPLGAISPQQWQSLASDDLRSLSPAQWNSVPPSIIDQLSLEQWAALGTDDLDAIETGKQLYVLDDLTTLQGGAGPDMLVGGASDDLLIGRSGADSLLGGAGRDTLLGGAGDDWLDGGPGADFLSPGNGDDVVWALGGGDTVQLEATQREGSLLLAFASESLGATLEDVVTLAAPERVRGLGIGQWDVVLSKLALQFDPEISGATSLAFDSDFLSSGVVDPSIAMLGQAGSLVLAVARLQSLFEEEATSGQSGGRQLFAFEFSGSTFLAIRDQLSTVAPIVKFVGLTGLTSIELSDDGQFSLELPGRP
jgi:hypothetical protein